MLSSQSVWANKVKVTGVQPGILPTTELGFLTTMRNGLLDNHFNPQLSIEDDLGNLASFSFAGGNMVEMLANPTIISTVLTPPQLSQSSSPGEVIVKDNIPVSGVVKTVQSEPKLDLNNRVEAKAQSRISTSVNKKILPASWQKILDSQKKTNTLNNFLATRKVDSKASVLIADKWCDDLPNNQLTNLSVSECRKLVLQKAGQTRNLHLAQTKPKTVPPTVTPVVTPVMAKPAGGSTKTPNSGGTVPPTVTPVVTPVTPKPAGDSTKTPNSGGTVPPVMAKPGAGSTRIPDYLNPNPNLLTFPTKPSEVKLQASQPLSLEQALELARRNNRELQVSLLQLEGSRSALREQQASLFPNLNLSTGINKVESPDFSSGTSIDGQAQINYNLYTSGARQAAIRSAEEQVRSSELTVEQQSETIRLNVTGQYYDLQQADQNVRISRKAVQNAEVSLKDTQALESAGVGTQFDVLRSRVNLANAQQDLVNALSSQRVAQRQLVVTLSLPQTLTVTASDEVKPAGLWDLSLEESVVLALQNRPELQQTLVARNQSEQRRRQALAQLGPQVSFTGQYRLTDQFKDTIPVNDTYSLRVQASLNLFDGGASRARAAQEKTNIAIAETNFANQRDQIRFEVERFYSQQESNRQNIQTANVAVDEAERALQLARLRFQAGVGTQTDVINSENDLTRAEGNQVQAILNYNRALASLQRSVTLRGLQRR
ncbi:TolC family protein [Calothrix sp. PCC 6303]|uniref:TolC family protein n=1 Tax=Calothrix sp. PCC 6303 TaxID=1170562 RepID=UPI002AB1A8D8|nr:TolC family protein [Calothrix sp. PCC 6303]